MRLTNSTDHALRLLLMAQEANGCLITIEQAAQRFHLSRANLMKVANELTSSGFLTGIRGRSGGLRLAKPASEIRIGDVVRAMETDFALVECLGEVNDCAITGICRLPRVFRRARRAFMDELDSTTLADVALRPVTVAAAASTPSRSSTDTQDLTADRIDVTVNDMKTPDSRPYESPLRRAQADATRDRILQALADVLDTTGGDEVMFDEIAKTAGVERRTVFRHFPNKTELLRAFWVWIGTRIGPQILPATLDELVAMPPRIFAGFDANENVIRASLHSSSGRAMRQEAVPARRQSFARVVEIGLRDLSNAQRHEFEALAHLLVSATAWETLKDYAGLSGQDAGKTVSRALTLLLTALRSESRGATPTAKGEDPMTAARSASVTTLSDAPSVWVIGDQVRFMGDVEGTNLSVVDVCVMPGSGTPPHRHASPEIFRVTEGEITFGIFEDGPPRTITAGVGTVVTIPSWLGHNYSNQSGKPARFAAVLEQEMVAFFQDAGSTVMPPPGPPSEELIGQIMSACQRHGIQMIGAA